MFDKNGTTDFIESLLVKRSYYKFNALFQIFLLGLFCAFD